MRNHFDLHSDTLYIFSGDKYSNLLYPVWINEFIVNKNKSMYGRGNICLTNTR